MADPRRERLVKICVQILCGMFSHKRAFSCTFMREAAEITR